ncbi:hypothetical protein AWH56_004970 [Anaerobacillus isosaccharinicus]|uniref:Uncharacterized protein n=1 Tax=Anaerobacillus isosaccharinicus TaxID=1532552 RepID=A0A1S2LAD4_9BACI|nr:hypothetical protein [Anaerobacillus isosaccharinicus]MBA5584622.1 hypothetical protein [Anaerobacillus isosaccharinicus]QOY37001.1 hypothetical protein AWH56_004970 [Anaerobacillus isosaccharinicus]
MKYVYSAIFILLLGFVVAAVEKHLNVEMAKTKNYDTLIQQETTIYELEPHGVPYEFTQDSHEYIATNQAIDDSYYGEATPVTSYQIKEPYLRGHNHISVQKNKKKSTPLWTLSRLCLIAVSTL